MPSFFGHFVGLPFRTELLIMNLLGLVNSMLDWSPLKWTNELERIWNLSLSQSAFILDTIGEDSIKTVLSWIVITRIVIAHVYTFTYVTNIYPILTWSRPNLLMPWLILSFFKNIVLEVIVIVIGLLLWYESRFSIVMFLEFIFVKLIPLLLSIYNWYSNSCLFLQLRYIEKTQKLKKTMRSDTNLLTTRLYTKLEDSKYRSRSLTTLLSCESYETYDTQDTISHIIDDSTMTPAKKTAMLLGLTENDVKDARDRIKERAERSRLTELDDESFTGSVKLFAVNNDYRLLEMNIEGPSSDTTPVKVVSSATNEFPIETEPQVKNLKVKNLETEIAKRSEDEGTREAKETSEQCVLRKKREGTDAFDTRRTKQMKMCSSCDTKDFKAMSFQRKKEIARLGLAKQTRRSVERSCSPVKLQALLNCNCAHSREDCCQLVDTILRTSTSNGRKENTRTNAEDNCTHRQKTLDRLYAYDIPNLKTDFTVGSTFPVTEKLLQNNLEMPKIIKVDDRSLENLLPKNDFSAQEIGQIKDNESEVTDCSYASIYAQNCSEIVKDLPVAHVTMNLDTSGSAEREDDTGIETDNTELQTMDVFIPTDDDSKNRVQKLPENSFEDTNLLGFFGGSMMVFDDCYGKDFDNNLELQCPLQQMEKKEWNLFTDQTNFETAYATIFSKQDDKVKPPFQDSGAVQPLEDNSKWTDKYETQGVSFLRENRKVGQQVSQMVQVNMQSQNDIPRKPSNVSVTNSIDSTRSVPTQVDEELQSMNSDSSFAQKKTRTRSHSKHKRFYRRNKNVSPVNNEKYRVKKTDSRTSLLKSESKSPPALEPQKLGACASNNGKKNLDPTKSRSYTSECECKIQTLEAKYCDSSDSRFGKKNQNRKTMTKPKMENSGVLVLTQVVDQANLESMVYCKKPPVYPKKNMKGAQKNASNAKISTAKHLESYEPKPSTNKPSTINSKTFRSKEPVKSFMEEPEIREMKALKAYNEITLLKDKKKLEAKRKSPFARGEDTIVKDSRNYSYAKKSNLDRLRKGVDDDAIGLYENYLNKENLFVDTATETDPSIASSSKDNKLANTASSRRSFAVSNEKHTCPKLVAINKVTDKLLDNYDRLHANYARNDVRKDKPVPKLDRKPYKKFSKPRKPIDEENLSSNSSKKLEGTQRGRDLDRTPAKEDVRDRTSPFGVSRALNPVIDAESRKYRTQVAESSFKYDYETVQSTSADAAVLEVRETESLTLIKSSVSADIVATWSSSTVDQVEDIQTVLETEEIESLVVEDREIPKPEEDEKETIEEFEVPEAVTIPSSHTIEDEASALPETEENRRTDTWQGDREGRRTSPDMTNFIRNINVNRLGHGVILANTNAQDRKSRQRDIIGDKTARMVHNAFFYKSMDSLLDLPDDFLTVEEMLNNNHLGSSVDEFVCHSNNIPVNLFADELPVLLQPGSQLGQTIVATIRDAQDLNRSEDNCDLCIITLDSDNLTGSLAMTTVDSYEDVEEHESSSLGDLQMSDLLSSLAEAFKCLHISDQNATTRTPTLFDILQSVLNIDETGAARNLEADTSEEEHEEREENLEERKQVLRIVEEEIFTNIKFPIVIRMSDLIPGVSNIRNADPRPAIPMIGYVEPTRVDLPSIEARKKEETDTDGRLQEIMRSMFATGTGLPLEFSSGRTNGTDREIHLSENRESSDDSEVEFVPKSDTLVNFSKNLKFEEFCLDPSKGTDDSGSSPPWEGLNITFEIMKAQDLDEEGENKIEIQEISGSFRDEDIEDVNTEYNVWEKIEEGIEDGGTKDEEVEDSVKIVEVETSIKLKEDEHFVEMLPNTILSFWLIVVYFYSKYFYEKIHSFPQNMRTMSTLKPFEIHTVSTSTSTLLEKMELTERIVQESSSEVDEENHDETYQNFIDTESTEILSSVEPHLRSVLDLTSDEMFEECLDIENCVYEQIKEDSEKMLTSMIDRVVKTLEKSSIPKSDDENDEEQDVRDPSTTESRDIVGHLSSKVQLASRDESLASSFVSERPLSPCSIEVQTIDNNLRPAKESSAIATNTRMSIFELEEQDLINLRASKQEVTTFEFKEIDRSESNESLLDDDRSKLPENNLSEELPANAKILRQEGPKEIQYGDGERTSNSPIVESNEKSIVKQATDSIPAENEETQTSVENVEPPETTLEEMDSFDSTYSVFFETVQNTTSFADFDSAMEEFSNASDDT